MRRAVHHDDGRPFRNALVWSEDPDRDPRRGGELVIPPSVFRARAAGRGRGFGLAEPPIDAGVNSDPPIHVVPHADTSANRERVLDLDILERDTEPRFVRLSRGVIDGEAVERRSRQSRKPYLELIMPV